MHPNSTPETEDTPSTLTGTVYYLNWHEPAPHDDIVDLYHSIHLCFDKEQAVEIFNETITDGAYKTLGTVSMDDTEMKDLEAVYKQLQRTGHHNSMIDEKKERSMCAGDIIIVDDNAYMAIGVGFVEVEKDTVLNHVSA